MKLVAVALLVTAMLCNSTLALAAGPVPFSALMRTAGEPPAIPPLTDDQSKSTQPPHATHMTTGGKVMTGVGIGMMAIGGVVLIGTAVFSGWASSSDKAKLYGAGAGTLGGGVVLIVLGAHQRSAQ
jgi:hypothetical protein